MGCCGSCSEKSTDCKDGNNEYEKIEPDDNSKAKTISTGIVVIVLIAGLLFLMI